MTNDYRLAALKRLAAGKHLTKAALEDLIDSGYVHQFDTGETTITTAGNQLLKNQKA